MFGNEPIKKVYTGYNEIWCEEEKAYDHLSNSFLDCYHELIFHAEPGESIVLETENHIIFIEGNGVSMATKPLKPRSEHEYFDPCVCEMEGEPDWVDLEQTLFEGECIISVEETDIGYIVHFTDFALKVIPYEAGSMREWLSKKDHWSYNYVLGCNRYLQRKCACGGEGEILMDFVSDFVVRCKKCQQSTWAGMNLIDAIEDWNAGELHCDMTDITIE